MADPRPVPDITVIIPVHNGGDDLARCLDAVYNSQGVHFECIVVDDASTDLSSEQEAGRHGARLLRMKQQGGPGLARNAGAREARAELLFFTDADVVLHPDALARAVKALREDESLGAVFGSYDDQPGHPAFLSRYRNLFHHWNHQRAPGEASTFWTGCGALRRDLFLELGGFSAEFDRPSIEDIELGYRIRRAGHAIRLLPDMQGQHLKHWRFFDMVRTDIFKRGAPWVVLLQRFENVPADLNLNLGARLATALVGLLVLCCLGLLLIRPLSLAPFAAFIAVCLLSHLTWKWGGPGPSVLRSLFSMGLAVLAPAAAWLVANDPMALLPLLLTAGVVAIKWPFYRLVARLHGWDFALAVVPQQLIFFLGCGLAVPLGLMQHWTSRG